MSSIFSCFLLHAVKKLKFGNARQSIGISALCDASRQIPSYLKMTGVRAIFKIGNGITSPQGLLRGGNAGNRRMRAWYNFIKTYICHEPTSVPGSFLERREAKERPYDDVTSAMLVFYFKFRRVLIDS